MLVGSRLLVVGIGEGGVPEFAVSRDGQGNLQETVLCRP